MSMQEENNAPAAPKPKRKYDRRKKRAAPRTEAAAAPPPVPPFLAGLTATDCASACTANGCVISGRPYCAHPHKGGLQGKDMHNPDAVRRLNAGRKILGTEELERKFGK